MNLDIISWFCIDFHYYTTPDKFLKITKVFKIMRNLFTSGLIGTILVATPLALGYCEMQDLKKYTSVSSRIIREDDNLRGYAEEIKKCPEIRYSTDPRDIVSLILEINPDIKNPDRIVLNKEINIPQYNGCPNQ